MKNDNHVWDNKIPTAQMLGRWHPWHEGHQKLFEEILKKTGQVNIMVRDVKGVDDNPFEFETVKKNILEALKGYENRIQIVSHIPKIELLKFIEVADALVLPNSAKDKMSLFTSPIKLFEYMASKRPIIASNIASIAEVLTDQKNALLFNPRRT